MVAFRCLVVVTLFWGSAATAVAHSPAEFLEVLAVKPTLLVEHDLQLQSKLDQEKQLTDLKGPQMFSRSVGCLKRAAKKQPAYLNWYKIVSPPKEAVREIAVLDLVRGSGDRSLKIQSAEYFLSPAQRIGSGAPDPIADGLDFYKAYRVVEAESLDRQVEITNSIGPSERRIGKPLFVCLPVQEWHHDEYFEVTHPNDGFVVYELDEQPTAQKFSTIDQFGLNELTSTSQQWLCVRAALLRITDK